MMAKRFFYVSLGILALALSWHLGARSARADLNPGGPGCIVGMDANFAFTDTGQAWIIDGSGHWQRYPEKDLPVSTTDIKFLNETHIIKYSEQAWIWSGQWLEADPFPGCGGTAVEKDSWGGVKNRWR